MKYLIAPLLLCIILITGCHQGTPVEHIDNPVVQHLTVENIGDCQGVFVWEGSVWLYGDRDGEGIIKRLEWVGPNDVDGPMFVDTGETYELKLYRNRYTRNDDTEQLPRNLIPNPTGITYHPDYDTFIANTDGEQGTIYPIHFLGLTESGSLDDWIMNKVVDDLATNGTRPEFVRYNGRWLIATADNSAKDNQIRLYNPDKLKEASKTSDQGVLVAAFDCEPYVQALHWIDKEQTLVLLQNQPKDSGYRLTLLDFTPLQEAANQSDSMLRTPVISLAPPHVKRVIDLGYPTKKLTGFAIIAPGWAVVSSASKENNVSIIRWPID